LHDIGKVGVPDAILLKTSRLSAEEFEVMKRHSEIGAQTLAGVVARYPNNRLARMGMEIAGCHHERWDGTGYPAGIAGEDIPLSARIVTVADQYDALRSRRPYKPAFDAARTRAILLDGDGRTMPQHFDPRVLAAFRAIAAEFDAIYEELRSPDSVADASR
jgi:putative two-component system response regulator